MIVSMNTYKERKKNACVAQLASQCTAYKDI